MVEQERDLFPCRMSWYGGYQHDSTPFATMVMVDADASIFLCMRVLRSTEQVFAYLSTFVVTGRRPKFYVDVGIWH